MSSVGTNRATSTDTFHQSRKSKISQGILGHKEKFLENLNRGIVVVRSRGIRVCGDGVPSNARGKAKNASS